MPMRICFEMHMTSGAVNSTPDWEESTDVKKIVALICRKDKRILVEQRSNARCIVAPLRHVLAEQRESKAGKKTEVSKIHRHQRKRVTSVSVLPHYQTDQERSEQCTYSDCSHGVYRHLIKACRFVAIFRIAWVLIGSPRFSNPPRSWSINSKTR